MRKKSSAAELAKLVGIPKSRGLEAVLKAQLIAAVVREVGRRHLTHVELATRSGLPRSAVTGILSGSLQKVTIDRLLRLVEAAGTMATMSVKSGQRIDVTTAGEEVIVELPDLILTLSPSDASKLAELLSLASRQAFVAGNRPR